ncbi:hypothetical protein Taro_046363 [Colocasia esculenta]|uniref:Uncharacterized protein n=1 Tax=Colocasia esculenta TaxID=4460 RepID=A0A843X240_COLES|nr:hypothetical protein [Colocasia esculenta]
MDYGVFMHGLVQAMQTQAQTQAALQAQLQAQAQDLAPVPQEQGHGGPSIMVRGLRGWLHLLLRGRLSPFWRRAG